MSRVCVVCESPFEAKPRQKICSAVCRKRRHADFEARWRKTHPEEDRDRQLRTYQRNKHRRRRGRPSSPVGEGSRIVLNDPRGAVFTISKAMLEAPPDWDDPYALIPAVDVVVGRARPLFAASVTVTPNARAFGAELAAMEFGIDKRLQLAPHDRKKLVARQTATRAIEQNKLTRGLCVQGPAGCKGTVEAHHADYDKPLEVTWLCRRHHTDLHTAQRRAMKVAA